MDTQKEFSCLEKSCKIYSKAVDVDGEYQETLPAYLDDIYRVVKCISNSYVTSADISFNEVKIYGKCHIQITYYNENSALCYADFEESFSKSIAVDNLSDTAFVRAVICDKYTNFRVINQRRIDVHTMSVLHISVYDTVKYPTLCSCENSKLKNDTVKTANIIGTHTDKIDFDEEVTLPADSKAVGRIISAASYPTLIETKIIKDKILVKAGLNTTILYTADTENGEIEKASYSFSFSKIIEKIGIDDGDFVIADIDIGSVVFKVKGTANEKISVINIFGDLAVNLTFIRESHQEIISDGYILGAESEYKYSEFSACVDGKFFSDTKTVSIPLEFNSEITDLKELSLSLQTPVFRDGKVMSAVDAVAVVSADGGIGSLSTSADIEVPIEAFDDAVVSVGIDGYDFTLSGSGRVDLRLSLSIDAYCYNDAEIPVLSDIIAGEEQNNNHTMTVYFGKENEKIWDIAKRFLSDESKIISENSLSGDTLDGSKILIIPRA